MRPTTAFVFALATLYTAAALQPAMARDDYGIPNIMVEEPGRATKKKPRVDTEQDTAPKQRAKPRARPRGSSYVPQLTLPRSDPARVAPTPDIYRPPPVNSYGDRATGCIHSFPLGAGIGNNPTDRQSYIRQCAN